MREQPTGGAKPDQNLFGDYISLLNPENTPDMHNFAIQNLDMIIDTAIAPILEKKSDYLALLQIIDLNLPKEHQGK